jgi:HEAT repeat protein
MSLDTTLLPAAATMALCWAALSTYVLLVGRRRDSARAAVSRILDILTSEPVRLTALDKRLQFVAPLLDRLSRDMILHTAAGPETPREAFEALHAYLLRRWTGNQLFADASSHRTRREQWRRTATLKVLFRADHPDVIDLLEVAVENDDRDVAAVALTLLGESEDPRATGVMIRALMAQRHPASLVATHLEHSPQKRLEDYRALLKEPDPVVRLWGATLLGQYPDAPELEIDLAPLTKDPDPRVRKAAIQSLGKIGDLVAAKAALSLLADPVPFVRAHAARALGDLDRSDCAKDVAGLLGDADWSVRAAAKHSLEAMGAEVWPVLVHCLNHSDGFVRNGAAEVFQNLGVLDSLIVMEAASDDPSSAKVDLLRRIAAAGGTRLTESLVERAGPATGARVRRLLATMGLEHVGAA